MAPQVITTTITFLFVMFITVSQATPHASGLNVSEVMMAEADDLKVAAGIFSALQIDVELKSKSAFTLFIPVDAAFKQIPDPMLSKLRSLTMDYTDVLMKAHVVRQYLPPTFLQSANTLSRRTLASEVMGTSMFHINISVRGMSTVTISTGVVEATVERTVYLQQPIAIYAISKVLLPTEMFAGSYVPPRHSPPPPPPPSIRSGQPPLLSPPMSLLVAALIFLFYVFVV